MHPSLHLSLPFPFPHPPIALDDRASAIAILDTTCLTAVVAESSELGNIVSQLRAWNSGRNAGCLEVTRRGQLWGWAVEEEVCTVREGGWAKKFVAVLQARFQDSGTGRVTGWGT